MRRVDFLVGQRDFSTMTAGQFMQQDVVYFTKSVKAQSIAAALTTGNFGSVPIINSEMRPVGIVSEYDLLKAMRQGISLNEISAEEVMSHPPVTVSIENKAGDVMKVLEDKHLIRVPVVDEEGKLVGMVARRDLLHGYLQSQVPDKVWWM
ncbi:MAG: CBS domain-containing protein [Candidatus Manganitrophaceae bacterium]|nr:MAG: CBS domain-containing protein [Candidatus Manganitrophaceae bacterium]